MNCLDDLMCGNNILIGIRGYTTNSISGLCINDLAGLSIKSAAGIVAEEQISAYQLLKDKIVHSTKMVISDLRGYISPYFKSESVLDSDFTGIFNATYLPFTATNRGLRIRRIRSAYAKILIKEIKVLTQTTGTITVNIIDGISTTLISIDVVANTEGLYPINYQAESDTIYITTDNTVLSVSSGSFVYNTAFCTNCRGGNRGKEIEVLGWNGSGTTSTLYGISARAILVCDDADIFCDLINKMDVIVFYRTGIEVYKELLLSSRLNPITLFNREAVEKELTALEKDYDKTFKTFKSSILHYLNNKKDVCIKCNGDRYVSSHP